MQIKISENYISYPDALEFMEARVNSVISGERQELIWFLQHEAVYTAGTSAKKSDLLDAKFPVYETGRGGEYTYHGPGQLVCYLVIDLKKRGIMDLKKYVYCLEEIIIKTLAEIGIKGERRNGRIGIWVEDLEFRIQSSEFSGENSLSRLRERARERVQISKEGKEAILSFAKNLRSNQTEAEKILWEILRAGRFFNLKFKRQKPFGKYIADFVCLEKKIIIELDGGQHSSEKNLENDKKRDEYFKSLGFKIKRYWNNQIFENLEFLFDDLQQEIFSYENSNPSPQPSPISVRGGEKKIAAIGIRVRKWVAYHGFAININPDLSHFSGIVPCGIKEYGVTSIEKLGITVSRKKIEEIITQKIKECFDG